MLSSTSNSEARAERPSRSNTFFPRRPADSSAPADRLPGGLGSAWGFALILTLLILAAIECNYRKLGFRPMLADDERLWAKVRDAMRPDDPHQIAIVGTSRIREDFDVHAFSHVMDDAPVAQLAIEGSDGLLVLEDLSRDEHFRGLLVFDVVPWAVFGNMALHDDTSSEYIVYHAQHSWIDPIETRLRNAAQLTFAFERLNLARNFKELRHQRPLEQPGFLTLDPDRGRRVDWTLASVQKRNQAAEQLMPADFCVPPAKLRENLHTLEAMIRRIESRGGRVALLCLPSTGAVGEAERAACPRQRYWDVLAATTSAITLHWMDDPRLLKFRCPDGSHLDMRDQIEFTRLFGEDLRQKLRAQPPTVASISTAPQ